MKNQSKFTLHCTKADKKLIVAAAKVMGMSVTKFVVDAAIRKAEITTAVSKVIKEEFPRQKWPDHRGMTEEQHNEYVDSIHAQGYLASDMHP